MKLTPAFYTLIIPILLLVLSCTSVEKGPFYQEIAVAADTLLIDNSTDTIIVGEKGTVLFFEKESFEMPDGTMPAGSISIQLKECYSTADMIRENLTTTADGEILETAGMIKVTAFAGGKELRLKEGKKFIVHFPRHAADSNKKMNLFYGQKSDTGGINWKVDSSTLLRRRWTIIESYYVFIEGINYDITSALNIRNDTTRSLIDYVTDNIDDSKFQNLPDSASTFLVYFVVDKTGKIRVKDISAIDYQPPEIYDDIQYPTPQYLYDFMNQAPLLTQAYAINGSARVPVDIEYCLILSLRFLPSDTASNEQYAEQFRKKYSSPGDKNITSVNEAELKYYIFSSSKLGWINCDYFFDVPGERIDFTIKVDPATRPDVKLILNDGKNILPGVLNGDKMVYKNIPEGHDVKIVAVAFKGGKPMLAVARTKTSKTLFDQLTFREFSLSELEKELSLK